MSEPRGKRALFTRLMEEIAMNNGNNGLSRWIQVLINLLIVIALSVSGYAISRVDQSVKKEDYRVDQVRMEKSIDCLSLKIDEVLVRLPRRE